jgi:hypothetical protein
MRGRWPIARAALDRMTRIPALTLAVMDAAILVPSARHGAAAAMRVIDGTF